MKISYNAAAMRASNALNASDNKVSKSLQRLSSGLKVTTAKDNPSGYAIGKRMNTQIVGIGTATQSSQNGISVIETADGALTEVHEMLQRMNELAVKGETGTLTSTDRKMLDQELKQLKEEITRIASDTQFNGQTLLDGTFDLRGYTNNHQVKIDYYSDEVIPKTYSISELNVVMGSDGKIDKYATKITLGPEFPQGVEISQTTATKITLTGPLDFEMTLEIPKDDAGNPIVGSVLETIDRRIPALDLVYELQYTAGANQWDFVGIDETKSRQVIEQALAGTMWKFDSFVAAYPKDSRIRLTSDDGVQVEVGSVWPYWIGTPPLPTDKTQNATAELRQEMFSGGGDVETHNLIIDITGIGSMDIQTGANEGQQLAIRIPTISLDRMGLEDITMLSKKLAWEVTAEEYDQDSIKECAKANEAIKGAILYVSDARSRLGAYQNRLEHTVNNLAVSNENMTASYSRIMDVDMAEEMTAYTTEQVISQAAVSMLAQANERPAQVLQLLQ